MHFCMESIHNYSRISQIKFLIVRCCCAVVADEYMCMCGLFCICMCVRVCVGCADLLSLDSMCTEERKRQGYIHELIQTEESYLEDLELALEVNQQMFLLYLLCMLLESNAIWLGSKLQIYMCVDIQVFHKPMGESGRLTEAEMSMIFVNWRELIMCSTKLLKWVNTDC